ncbi:MAG: hypothetical protein IT260_14785 [Saprospiraceae bacterium]|nr:hypothetical protein [Saprospiraceae bacterium]
MKRICIVLCLAWLCPDWCCGQMPEPAPGKAPACNAAAPLVPDSLCIWEGIDLEKYPSFPGGDAALLQFWSRHFEVPRDCAPFSGSRIVLSFVVETNGDLSQVEVLKLPHPCLEPAVRAVLAQMPCWVPGEWEGQVKRTRMHWPLRIRWE